MTKLPTDLYTAKQVREIEKLAIEREGLSAYRLMTRAGRAAFHVVRRYWPQARKILVLCGPGNNGGDGYVVARLAREAGLEVRVAGLGSATGKRSIELDAARDDFRASGGEIEAYRPSMLDECELVVDAVLGIGVDRTISTEWQAIFQAINAGGKPVLSLDVPSGLCANTGRVWGDAIRATMTVCFIALKQGLFTASGPDHAGQIEFNDLGVSRSQFDISSPTQRQDATTLLDKFPPRRRNTHKGSFGSVLIVGGDHGMPGAVRLAGEAALRSGAGLVFVATHPNNVSAITAGRPELIVRGTKDCADITQSLSESDVLAIGPGLGTDGWGQKLFDYVLNQFEGTIVLDADGLNLLARSKQVTARNNWILTPHPGEAARLLGASVDSIQENRFESAKAIASRFGGVCVLKGAGTIVSSAGRQTVSDVGNPGMATAGMGDVLTGVIAGLVAQEIGGASLHDKAAIGVLVHGAAGDRAALNMPRGMLASDLFDEIRAVVNHAHV